MSSRHLYVLVFALSVIGLGMFVFKVFALGFPMTPYESADIWDVEASISFEAKDKPVKISLLVPRNTQRISIVNENFISRGYGLITRTEAGNRQAVWSTRKAAGTQTLYYHATVQRAGLAQAPVILKPPEMHIPGFEGPFLEAANALLAEIVAQSSDLDIMIASLLKRLHAERPDNNVLLLLGKKTTPQKTLQAAVDLLALNGTAARAAHGIRLREQGRDVPLIHWLQVYDNGVWRDYHPVTGEPEIPDDYMFWWHGPASMLQSKGVDNLQVRLAVSLSIESALSALVERGQILTPRLLEFSLFSLPIHTQSAYRILLMIPVGALLLVVLRNVVGIKTFGTFTPVLIALAFRETQLLWGIVFFSIMVAFGLTVRFYLEHLKLLLVPRLASVLITVVLLMAAFSVLSHRLGIERGLSVAIFPMVILTMTIERMSVVWEERGAGEAMQQGLGSLLVAAAAYSVMRIGYVEHLLFVFPELLLVFLACTLLLGRYKGYRLTELIRFKVFAENPL